MKIKITHNLTSQKNYFSQHNSILIYFLTDIFGVRHKPHYINYAKA